MTATEMNKTREVLEMKAVELDRSMRRRDGIQIERTADSLDGILRATEREVAVRNLEAKSVRLRDTRAALERIQDGSYGFCEECGEAISPARLRALPWAALCIRCQEAADCRCGAARLRAALPMAA